METTEETKTIVLETEPTTEAETEPQGPEERKEVDGKIQSYLTGEMVDVAKANRRPVAVMMSNDKASLPQYGINRADVVYEAPVEGDMTRSMPTMGRVPSRFRTSKMWTISTELTVQAETHITARRTKRHRTTRIRAGQS